MAGLNDSWFDQEVLSAKDRFNELLLTGLRTSWGVNLNELYQISLPTEDFEDNVRHFEEKEWLMKTDTHLMLTNEGRLMADYIASLLFI